MSTILELKNIRKSFDGTEILKGISLSIEEGEFITFLGASGCGKTTTLRMIAGLETPDFGSIILEGTDVTAFAPEKRNVNTVFQNYALFPHMNVEGNIGYALKLKKMPRAKMQQKILQALKLVQLEGFEKRRVNELSGGQKQRVAIARAIVNEPKVLLLDEPLGALDLQLRRQMQTELKRLQKKLGITFLYITHDQEEAINMSDRIVVMRNGQFEQIGTPEEIYHHPKSRYVAQFVGNANVLKAVAQTEGCGQITGLLGKERISVTSDRTIEAGETFSFAVRGEQMEIGESGIRSKVLEKTFAGGLIRVELQLEDGQKIVVNRYGLGENIEAGDVVSVSFAGEHAVVVEE